jgi:site-specific recombinase XerD
MLTEIEGFINWTRRRNAESRTWRDYGYDLRQFAALVGDKPPGEVTFRDVDAFVIAQSAQGRRATTIKRRLAAIQALYAYLSDDDPTLVCPVLPHRHGLPEPKRLPRPVQREQLDQFFAVIADARDRAMFILMLRCGLRIAEVAGLKLVDLYLNEERPRLVARGRGGKERSAYLSPQAVGAVEAYLAERPQAASEHVFLSYLGRGLSTTAIHYRLMRYRQQAGLTLTAHRLRHTFADDLLSVDVPVTTIQKLLGHAWLETTQGYVAANDRAVQADYFAAYEKLDGWQ